MDGGNCYPFFDPEFDPLSENIPPLRVSVDNETRDNHTIIKVDSANIHGILLEMVQVLSDLNLVISKSYISSDGGWLMDVFHVTDHHGHKLTDPNLIQHIRKSLSVAQKQKGSSTSAKVKTSLINFVRANSLNSYCSALEITTNDHPGLLSEVTAILSELSCGVGSGEIWTHNGRAAFILYITEQFTGQPISDPTHLGYVEEQVRCIVKAHHFPGELWRVRLLGPTNHQIHTERRLHQLMQEDKDYEIESPLSPFKNGHFCLVNMDIEAKRWLGGDGGGNGAVCGPYVSIETWKERDYLVVNVRSRDRPKLLFDTVCTLTDLDYDVFHASMSSHGSIAIQEYYVRRMDGCLINKEMERQSIVQCLVAAVERRIPHGQKIELRTLDQHGWLSDLSRAFRENGLSLDNAKFAKEGNWVIGTFYITDFSSSVFDRVMNQQRLEALYNTVDSNIIFDKKEHADNEYLGCRKGGLMLRSHFNMLKWTNSSVQWSWNVHQVFYSLGSLMRSYIDCFSKKFGFIQS
ncbi:ACT domain-containing protein ACR4-like [Phalaenopsis equestris]|uniref:ACT domain-containing protein ACR4-like n=1 Tax=Phalaenopsis equestris TaxID=78828 RepID=UPI0009E4BC9C|nr:ACT domain-containing protein ACR4-like [Phalaenopsis equestris]